MINREKLYDLIYNKADKLLKKYNPCNIHKTEHKLLVCNNKQYCSSDCYYGGKRLCCYQCGHWRTTGCSIKCLACKVTMCTNTSKIFVSKDNFDDACSAINADKIFRVKMWKLIRVTIKYDLFLMHSTKQKLLRSIA